MNIQSKPLVNSTGTAHHSAQKNDRFKKQPKQSPNNIMDYSDVVRQRKNTSSSTLQLAAGSIIESTPSNLQMRMGGSISHQSGLPPRGGQERRSIAAVDHYSKSQQIHIAQSNSLSPKTNNNQNETPAKALVLEDQGADTTDDYIVDMKKGNSNILVAVRCRPLSTKEKQKQTQKSVKILDEKLIIVQDISAAKPEEAFRVARSKEKTYAFDYAFDEHCTQGYIFERTTKFLIAGIMQGYNASVFAYGATGAGKTHTMLGTETDPGIMMLSIQELFRSIESYQQERDYKLKVSYVEVYNETIRDLLTPDTHSELLELREDHLKGVCVAGVTEIMTTNLQEIELYIRQGNRNRTKERTDANETSSRSHAVLQITVEHKDRAHGISAEINVAKLSLIDLAGSERASNTNNRGLRLIEGANINKSLLALGNCINALCDLTKAGGNRNMHVPYRDSKLTRLLKDSLGGNCRTVMITNISPAFSAYEDTLNTLKYADRAKQIKTVVKRNVLNVDFHISNYTKIITQLRDEILSLRTQLTTGCMLPKISPSAADAQKQLKAQNQMKEMKIQMNLHFEKELLLKRELQELDRGNEELAFRLFSRQMAVGRAAAGGTGKEANEEEISSLKEQINQNSQQKQTLTKKLQTLESSRNKILEGYQQELIPYQEVQGGVDVIYNQHLMNLKQIDIKRKENRAEFHIKQRDNYILQLREQLAMRDKIIKEKLGISVTNFMPQNGQKPVENGIEILSIQDIDKIQKELILPQLNMTKSSPFIPNQNINSPQDNQLIIRQDTFDPNDSPYSSGGNKKQKKVFSPYHKKNNLILANASRKNGSGSSGIKQISSSVKSRQNTFDDIQSSNSSNIYPVVIKPNHSNNYLHQVKSAYQEIQQLSQPSAKPVVKSVNGDAITQKQSSKQIQSEIKSQKAMTEVNNDSHQDINMSFQSQKQSSSSRLQNVLPNLYQGGHHIYSQGNISESESPMNNQIQIKSFASEMSRNKQRFMLLQKNQDSTSPSKSYHTNTNNIEHQQQKPIINTRNIPKHPQPISNMNRKLALIKNQTANQSANTVLNLALEESQSQQLSARNLFATNQNNISASSAHGRMSQNVQRQNYSNQLNAHFNMRRPTYQNQIIPSSVAQSIHNNSLQNINNTSVNNSLINIADI